jgi:MFS transporter, ACS family, pantothenate transporter
MLFVSIMAIIFPTALAATPVHPADRGSRWVLYCKLSFDSQKSNIPADLLCLDLTALTGICAGIVWTWVNEVSRLDPEKRAYIGALVGATPLLSDHELEADRFAQMNSFGYIFTAWVPIFTFPANKQPYIVAGNYITAGFGGAAATIVLVMAHLHNRDLKKQKREVMSPNAVEDGDSVA